VREQKILSGRGDELVLISVPVNVGEGESVGQVDLAMRVAQARLSARGVVVRMLAATAFLSVVAIAVLSSRLLASREG